jgi:general secretion pathway protein A
MSLFEIPPYLEKYGLQEAPYSTKPNERYLYLTPTHKEAIATVAKVVRDKEGAALIYGKYGTGKTTLMRRLYMEMRDQPKEFRVALIENAGHCPTDFQLAAEVIESFGGKSLYNYRKGRNDQVKEMLFANYTRGITSVLMIDEAQELPARVLEALRGYLNYETGNEKILQIILFALPSITRKLAYAKTFRNRLWRTELREMTRAELEEMLRWRFQQAGGKVFPFELAALDRLYQLTNGHPRSSCALAQLALEVAAIGSGSITPDIINQVKEKRFLEGDHE